MAENMLEFINKLPSPEVLWARATENVEDWPESCALVIPLMESTPQFSMFKTEDGAGAEGTILIRRNADNKIDAVLMFAYDHESSLTANIENEEGAKNQPALSGLPAEFDEALIPESPLLWKYDGYPATFSNIFATAAVWYVDGEWSFAEDLSEAEDFDGNPINETKMARQFPSIFEGFRL